MVSDKFRLTCSGLLVLYLVGLILYLVGFSTDYWAVNSTTHNGVWRHCFLQTSDSTWNCDNQEVDYYDSWEKAVVAFLILGLLSGVFGGILYMFVPLAAALQIFTGVCTIISIAVYAAETISTLSLAPYTLGWSFYVTMAGGICIMVNGITLMALMAQEDDGLHMDKVLPREPQTKVGTLDRYPMHTYS